MEWRVWYRKEDDILQAVVTCGALEPDRLSSDLAVWCWATFLTSPRLSFPISNLGMVILVVDPFVTLPVCQAPC